MPHRFADERPEAAGGTARRGAQGQAARAGRTRSPSLQWDMKMIGATPTAPTSAPRARASRSASSTPASTRRHPDIAPNFSHALSRNFTIDRPDIDGPCETPTCIDPANVDDGGHGTHVAGTVAAARNGIGITGVAPDATIVNVRAGQDSGYFFLYETVAALIYAGDAGLDVVNMSFYTDPWLYNCESADDYVSGAVTAGAARRAGVRSGRSCSPPPSTPTTTA